MKKINGKYIRLTESELREVVKKEVNKQLSIILEYAIPRAKFIENAYNLSNQIIENWCLIHYCTLTGRTDTKEHWKDELYAHMENVTRKVIKKNNSYEVRLKAITEGFEWEDLLSGPDRISMLILRKFKKENIDTSSKEYLQCIEDCFNSVNTIIDIMAKFNPSLIYEYIKTI